MSQPPSFGPPIFEEEIKVDRRSFYLQVILPLCLGVVIIAGVFVLIWRGGVGTASSWADTSLIFLMIPLLCAGLVPLAIVGALFYGIFKLTVWLPGPMRRVDGYVERGGRMIRRATDVIVRPMFVIKGAWAVLEAFFLGLASLVGFSNGESHE